MLNNSHILVTGAAGSIGSELVRQLAPKNKVFCLDINETALFDLIEELRLEGYEVEGKVGDVRDNAVLSDITARHWMPDIVFHAAALKHVTPCEWNPEEAVKTNVLGTHNVISLAKRCGAVLVNISTDKAADPHTVMGMTKRMGEIMVQNAGYVNVRFANVLGSRGSVIPIWQKQADEKKPLTITHPEMERYFMSIPQAVSLVIGAYEIGEPGDTLILDMGRPIKIIELAREIIAKANYNPGIREIGIRPGETLTEKLMTAEEEKIAVKKDNYWVIKKHA